MKSITDALTDDWRRDALCQGQDTDLWFPTTEDEHVGLERFCRKCPVRQQCLAYALEYNEDHGTFAIPERPRRRIRWHLARLRLDHKINDATWDRWRKEQPLRVRTMLLAGVPIRDVAHIEGITVDYTTRLKKQLDQPNRGQYPAKSA